MLIIVLILIATSLQAGIILCDDHVGEMNDDGVADILHRLEELEKREADSEKERQLWKQRMDDMQTKLTVVLTENKELKRDIYQLKDRITNIENESEELRKELMNIKTENRDNEVNVKNDDSELESNIHKILTGLKPIESDIESQMKVEHVRYARDDVRRIQRADNELGVAFYATLSGHWQHVGVNQNIPFETIITNEGNAFNIHAGDFRAPVSGTYVFSTSLMALGSHTTHYYFAKNGTPVGNIYVRGQESPFASSSMTVVLRLNAGDDVAVRNRDGDEPLHGSNYNSFSGFLLQQDFSVPAGTVVG